MKMGGALCCYNAKLQFVGQLCTMPPEIHVIPREQSDRGNLNKNLEIHRISNEIATSGFHPSSQ